MRLLRSVAGFAVAVIAGVSLTAPAGAQPNFVSFPDVPPWHWAYQGLLRSVQAGMFVGYPTAPAALVENAITQVYDGFAHAQAPEAEAWFERFTFNRPAGWPGPLARAQVVFFSLRDVMPRIISGDAATAAFVAETRTRAGRTATEPMRVNLRLIGGDWKIDYATLAAGSPIFR